MIIIAAPILFNVAAFDKANKQKFYFSWNGNQAFKNRLQIFVNSNSTKVYDQTQDSMQLYHTLASGVLTNGTQYRAVLSVFDSKNNESVVSSPVLFYCYTNPTFSLNISNTQIIKNSSYTVELSYSQSEGELLQQFEIILYDSSQSQIYSTDVLYPTVTMSTVISGLANSKQYYIQATGTTVEGTFLSTGMIEFSVNYVTPTLFSKVELTNLPNSGQMKVTSHMISIEGKSNPSHPTYIDSEKIDLTVQGSYVAFDSGYSIADNFTGDYTCQTFTFPSDILTMTNGINTIKITVAKALFDGETEEKMYAILTANNSYLDYRIVSNHISVPEDSQQVRVTYQRIDNLYNIRLTPIT